MVPRLPLCRPFMPEVEEKYSDFILLCVSIAMSLSDLCVKLDVFGIPSFVAYNKGEETGRYVNKDRKHKNKSKSSLKV